MKAKRRNLDATAFDGGGMPLEESDPMASTANLVDAMLVFACGLLMALVMRYNVDLTNVKDIDIQQDMSEVTDIDQMAQDLQADGAGYTELGTVYQDPATGKMYMITEEDVEGANGSGGSGSSGTGSGQVNAPSRANGAD